MFEKLLNDINFEIIRRIFRMELEAAPAQTIQIPKEESPKEKDLVFKSASQTDPFKESPTPPPQQHLPTSEKKEKKSGKATVSWRTVADEPLAPSPKKQKIGRNDPCWCGSGKKYKKCHYPN
jgi:preprotein translocase subunit SecA